MIRSLTIGLPVGSYSHRQIEVDAVNLIETSKRLLKNAEIMPRTIRYTLPPVGLEGESSGYIDSMLRWVDGLSDKTGVRWFCLPIDLIEKGPREERLSVALSSIGLFPKMFLNLMVSNTSAVNMEAIQDAASLVLQVSKKSNNGFDNFRVGASCGCPANAPYFPFSHHDGQKVGFSFALEITDLALSIVATLGSHITVDKFRDQFVTQLSAELKIIDELGHKIAFESKCQYKGLDSSLAPFPNGHTSVAKLLESLLGAPVGSHGSVFITALLTDAIRAALIDSNALAVGFNGVMFSLLEDDVLASANSRRNINLNSLVGLSSVCGCGVDMVPISGTSFTEEIAVLIADIAAMSMSLKKPLGIRVLPIPNGSVNEYTNFNLDFLCDSRIIGLTSNEYSIRTEKTLFGMLAPSRL